MVVDDSAHWSRSVGSGWALSSANASSRVFMMVQSVRSGNSVNAMSAVIQLAERRRSARFGQRAQHGAYGARIERGQLQRQRDQFVVAGCDGIQHDAFENRHAVSANPMVRVHRL